MCVGVTSHMVSATRLDCLLNSILTQIRVSPLLPWREARSAAKPRNLTPLAGDLGTMKK